MNIVPSKSLACSLMAGVFLATWWQPIWPAEQALHTSLTLVAFVLLWQYLRRYRMSDLDFFLLVLFLCVHSVAARWLYSNVPYDHCLQAVTGFSLHQYMGWTRNHFDRLVHFLYGFCFTPVLVSHFIRYRPCSPKNGFMLAMTLIMLTSLWYEWFEWLIALMLSDADAEAYNGQQGDMWDAHKDMLLATVGSLAWAWRYRSAQTVRLPSEL